MSSKLNLVMWDKDGYARWGTGSHRVLVPLLQHRPRRSSGVGTSRIIELSGESSDIVGP